MFSSSVGFFLNFWAWLYGDEEGGMIKNCASQMLHHASVLHSGAASGPASSSSGAVVLMITNGGA